MCVSVWAASVNRHLSVSVSVSVSVSLCVLGILIEVLYLCYYVHYNVISCCAAISTPLYDTLEGLCVSDVMVWCRVSHGASLYSQCYVILYCTSLCYMIL